MKIAVTSKGPGLDSPVDPRFGRAAYLLVVDDSNMNFEVVDNGENVNAFKGAGIQAATAICDKGVEVLLTGYCGPNAFQTLQTAGIRIVNDVSGAAREAVSSFLEGKYAFAEDTNVDGHW